MGLWAGCAGMITRCAQDPIGAIALLFPETMLPPEPAETRCWIQYEHGGRCHRLATSVLTFACVHEHALRMPICGSCLPIDTYCGICLKQFGHDCLAALFDVSDLPNS